MVRDGRSKTTFDDKVAQQVMAMVLEAVYEQDFLPCSYGFRPGRSAYQALSQFGRRHNGAKSSTSESRTVLRFPRGCCMRTKPVRGFSTGDMVRAEVPKSKKAAMSAESPFIASGSFQVNADGIGAKDCKLLHRADGYGNACRPALPPPTQAGGS
jgi:hypothetical protein